MSLIYPFHAIEKNYELNYEIFRKDVVNGIIDVKYVAPCDGDFKKYADVYGYEAARMFFLLHPIVRKIKFNDAEVFGCWKIMNRIWNVLNTENALEGNFVQEFEKYLLIGEQAVENAKLHIYISSITHILKLFKKEKMNAEQKKDFVQLIKFSAPLLHNCIA